MTVSILRPMLASWLALLALSGCGSLGGSGSGFRAAGSGPSATNAIRRPYVAADVHFIAGMIPHHAQAIRMAEWAETHGARADLRILAARMVVAQRDEIALLQTWLADRGEVVPPADATHHRMTVEGVEHQMLMPGMLTPEEMARLDAARGCEFDHLFLTFMIRHHEGALAMVDELFASYGAAQDDMVYKIASDMYADQSTEIHHMQKLLDGLPAAGTAPC
jgi:uncharacterized protein (DUF305 family)